MENILPRYERPLKSTNEPQFSNDYWDEAVDAFDEKEYKKSIISVINYMNSNVLEGVDTSGNINITQMQGSAEINISITNDKFSIKVPFLKITPDTNEIALLRRVAEVNFTNLDIEQIKLQDKKLFFTYESSLKICQPRKMYSLIRNVCLRADEFDDEFIENYGAEFYKTPNTKTLSTDEQEKAWTQISNIFEDYNGMHDLFREKRWDNWQWDAILISLLKLSNMPYLQGTLRSELIDNVEALYNSDTNFQTRVDRGTNYINMLSKKSKDEFMDNLYHADQFVSLLWRSDEEIIEEKMENIHDTVEEYDEDESHFNQSYYLQGIFLKLIYNYNLEDSYKNAINNCLEKVAGLSPEEAAPILLDLYNKMYHASLNEDIDTDSLLKRGNESLKEVNELMAQSNQILKQIIFKAASSIVVVGAGSYAAYKFFT